MVATTLATATAALILGAAHASSPVQLAIDPSAIAGYAPHACTLRQHAPALTAPLAACV